MNYSRYLSAAAIIPVALTLSACGGGSGGPGGPGGSGSGGTFLGFSEIKPNSTVKIQGTDAAGEAVTAETKYDKDGDLEAVTVTTKNGGAMTWDTNNSEENEDAPAGLMIADRKDGASSVGVARPEENGFEYQTYGAWVAYDGDGSVTDGGGFSVGSPTEAAKIDTSGTAKFEGTAAGLYVTDGGDTTDVMTAKAQLDVDFAGRSIDFKTSDSQLAEAGAARPDLDMSGTLTYAAGTNGFNGSVSTAGMNGTASGSFYGPAAEEAGGSFSLDGGDEHLRGGFGAVRK